MSYFGDVRNGFKPPEDFVDLPLGNKNPVAEMALVASILYIKGIITMPELEQVADKVLLKAGVVGLLDVSQLCKEVEEKINSQ